MNKRILCTHVFKQLWSWWQRYLVYAWCPRWGTSEENDFSFSPSSSWFHQLLFTCGLLLKGSEWESIDRCLTQPLTEEKKKTFQELMGIVCLCPLGPKLPFLNEFCLLFITCNHISYCNVRAMPRLHSECWKWALKHKAKPEIPPAGDMVVWQVFELHNGISSYCHYKRYQSIQNNGLFFPVCLGYSWHSCHPIL